LKVKNENSRIRIYWSEAWIRGSGSIPKYHGSTTLFYIFHELYCHLLNGVDVATVGKTPLGHHNMVEGPIGAAPVRQPQAQAAVASTPASNWSTHPLVYFSGKKKTTFVLYYKILKIASLALN
jgi:hypothetical protein